MKRLVRRLAWVGVALCLVALAFGVTVRLLPPPPPGVTEANLRRIRKGMTLQEVEGIFGKQGARVLNDPRFNVYGKGYTSWAVKDLDVILDLGNDGRIVKIVCVMSARRNASKNPIDRLRDVLGW